MLGGAVGQNLRLFLSWEIPAAVETLAPPGHSSTSRLCFVA